MAGASTPDKKASGKHTPRRLPYFDELPPGGSDGVDRTAWGVWGDDDELGTVNLLDEQAVLRGVREASEGRVVSLNWRADQPGVHVSRPIPRRTQLANRPLTRDDYIERLHLQYSTQWDGLRHVGMSVGFYNRRTPQDVDGTGTVLGIDKWAAHGIAGRGVLLDVAGMLASEGQPIDPGATFVITPEMLDRTAQHQGLQFAMADILLVRTGWVGWYEALSSDRQRDIEVMRCSPGLEASQRTARWLWDHRIAAAAADNMALESQPFRPGFPVDSLHAWLLAAFGMPIGELFALDELAAQCARRRHWSFCLTASPFNFPGGVGSPGNALAIL